MEQLVPMDRVVCGDVGYGKTEIAVRAAFKAVQDGKQVAVLVPTTLLAQQHFATFSERMAQFPVTVRSLSRFDSPEETSRDARRSGGRHRRHRDRHPPAAADRPPASRTSASSWSTRSSASASSTRSTSSSCATVGGRADHVGDADPADAGDVADRHPGDVHDPDPAGGAAPGADLRRPVRREAGRPRRSGASCCARARSSTCTTGSTRSSGRRPGCASWCPRRRIAVGHGQMNEDALERVMLGFWEKEFDVLVCTTIVESGLDIANANTLIVERADTFGLSQLHQLRGRVGRGRERAYAYFLYPPEKPLTETAHDRLATIAPNTDLGAGMQVAMKDLEIRGAGNLLGGEQSGHIAGRRLRPLRAAGRRGGGRVPRRRPGRGGRGRQGRPAGRRAPAARLHPGRAAAAGGVPGAGRRRARTRRWRRSGPSCSTGTARCRSRWRTCWRWPGSGPSPARYGVTEVSLQGSVVRFSPVSLRESQELRMHRLHPRSVWKGTVNTISVPRPAPAPAAGSGPRQPVRDVPLLEWARSVLTDVLGAPPGGSPRAAHPVAPDGAHRAAPRSGHRARGAGMRALSA